MKKHTKLIKTIIKVSIIALIFAASLSSAETSQPPIPNSFSGSIKFVNPNGQLNAPAGTLIEALIDNIVKGSTIVTAEGGYVIDVAGTNEDDSKEIIFRVNNIIAEQSSVFSASLPDPRTLDLTVNMPAQDSSPPASSSGSGSSGGGGGGTSGENYTNIEVKEKYDQYIFKDETASYMFTNKSNPILFVNITGNVNAGEITTMVEVLKGTSTLVNSSAPGQVYKNINIWVGTSGFASPRNIKEATITFMVEDSWLDINNLDRNDIRLVKWDGSDWITLETSEKMRNGAYTYFEAKTSSFSPFAITGLESDVILSATPGITTTVTSTPSVTQTSSEKALPINWQIILGLIVLVAVSVAVYAKRKH